MKGILFFILIFLTAQLMGQTNSEKLFKQCKKDFESKKYQDCIETCKLVLQLDINESSNSELSNSDRNKVYSMRTKSYSFAMNNLDSLIAKDSSQLNLFYERGKLQFDLGLIRFAFEDIDYFLSKDSSSRLASKAYYLKGSYYNRTGKFNSSIRDCTKSIKIDTSNYEAYLTRSQSYLMTMNCKKGLKDIETFINKNPEHADAYLHRATLRINLFEGIKKDIPKKELEKICNDLKKGIELGCNAGHDFIRTYCSD